MQSARVATNGLMHDEPGADLVAAAFGSASLGTVNLAEVVGKLVDAGVDARPVRTCWSLGSDD